MERARNITSNVIRTILNNAVKGTEKDYCSEKELEEFASEGQKHWDEFTSEDVIAEAFIDRVYVLKGIDLRRCSVCGKLMREGYMFDNGESYYCSDECLHVDFLDIDWQRECEKNMNSCWTQWTEENRDEN